jgi:hypothetical protein
MATLSHILKNKTFLRFRSCVPEKGVDTAGMTNPELTIGETETVDAVDEQQVTQELKAALAELEAQTSEAVRVALPELDVDSEELEINPAEIQAKMAA